MTETPSQLGFKMPAEWEAHEAVWLAWPYDKISFGSLNEPEGHTNKERLIKVEQTVVEIIKAIHQSESVELLVLDGLMHHRTSTVMQKAGVDMSKITFHITDYADVWLRDYGPMFISNPKTHEQAWVKWTYNAYGKKFPDLLKDNEVFFRLRGAIDKRMFEPGLVLEGGSIEVNGNGVCLTTEQCLLENSRNPGKSKQDMEKYLADYLGIKKTIWLKKGLVNDHTDGHIDNIAKFVSPTTILCAYDDETNNPNFKILEENYRLLQNATDINGNKFELIKLPMPHMTFADGNQAPISYTNAYISNEVVLTLSFQDPNDAKVLEIYKKAFPDKKIIAIDARELVYGGGAIHCMTQQQPAV